MLQPDTVTATDYRHLEKCLSCCDEVAAELSRWTPKDLEIRDEIHAVLAKVVVERIRAEEREKLSKVEEGEPQH